MKAKAEKKIVFLDEQKISVEALLACMAEFKPEAVVILFKEDGCWGADWSGGITNTGLCMASIKLQTVVQDAIHGCNDQEWSPPENESA